MAIFRGSQPGDELEQALRELGERLKNIREAQGLSLAAISRVTKIQKHYLLAIEEGALEELPSGPYVRGFIRQYCEILSAPDIWSQYDVITCDQGGGGGLAIETLGGKRGATAHRRQVFKARSRWMIYVVVVVSLAVAVWVTWSYRGEITSVATNPVNGGTAASGGVSEAPQPQSALSAAQSGINLSWMDGVPLSAPPAVNQPPAVAADPVATVAKNVLQISVKAKVWLQVSSGEQVLYSGTLKPGESKSFTVGDRAVKARFGNPGGAAVTWNGKTFDPVGPGATKPLTKIYRPDGTVADR